MKTDTDNLSPHPCFECEGGILTLSHEDYHGDHPEIGAFTVPKIPIERCQSCGDSVFAEGAGEMIDAFLDKALNVISPEELQAFMSKYQLTQKAASQITGYGEKNISRWLSGRLRPSQSVSNFFRVLSANETAFEQLRSKNFSDNAPSATPEEERQPDTQEKDVLKSVDYPALVQFGIVTKTNSPKERRTQLCQWARVPDLLAFEKKMEEQMQQMAAFKDTSQKSNCVSGGVWTTVGEQVAAKIETSPYDRDKLRKAVKELKELTVHPIDQVAEQAQTILAKAGVALVFVPLMKESALRGCTRLLTPSKALIIHSLKFRSVSQFWIILFHEIAHLLLHITKPDQVFLDYEDQASNEQEQDADSWAHDSLFSVNRNLELSASHSKPAPWQLESYARKWKVHPAILAEIFNNRANREVIAYSYLRKEGLYPALTNSQVTTLMDQSKRLLSA